MRQLDGRWAVLLSALLLGAAVAFPLGVIASHQFSDVPTSNSFHNDIDAIADAGVTLGCGGGNYCPDDFVTREQMAAFMNRLGALGAGKTPVVNATRLDGRDSTDFLGTGNVAIPQRGPWFNFGGATTPTIAFNLDDTTFAGTDGQPAVILALQAPGTIDGQQYGLASLRVCHAASTNTTIVQTHAIQTVDSTFAILIEDPTDRELDGAACYTLTDPTPTAVTGGAFAAITFTFDGAGVAHIGTVTSTWTPVP